MSERTCPWCSATASDGATACPECGAALAQRETIGDITIPGVTSVAPSLQAYGARPLRLRPPSPSQGVAAGVIAAAALGGPVGLAALGGIAAVAATEYRSAGGDDSGPVDLDGVGRPSEAALMVLAGLESAPQGHDTAAAGGPAVAGAESSSRPDSIPIVPEHDPWWDLPGS